MNDFKGIVEGMYTKFLLRDFFGFWVPGLVLIAGVRDFWKSANGWDPATILPTNQVLFYGLVIGLPYGAGLALQIFPNLSERFWLCCWKSSLSAFYKDEKAFLEKATKVPHLQEIRERVAFLKLMALKLAIACAVVVGPHCCLAAIAILAGGFFMHWELFQRYYEYTRA